MNNSHKYIQSFIDHTKQSIENMFGLGFDAPQDDQGKFLFEESKGVSTSKTGIVSIPFNGHICGEYYLFFNPAEWRNIIEELFAVSPEEQDLLFRSSFKELLNTSVGASIQAFKEDFPDLTFASPRLIFGDIDFPKIYTLKTTLTSDSYDSIECALSLDLMQQDISVLLDTTIKEKVEESLKAKKAEASIESILDNIAIGIFNINLEDGKILPGCSQSLQQIFAKELNDIVGHCFLEACPEELQRNIPEEIISWFSKLESTLQIDLIESFPNQLMKVEVPFKNSGSEFGTYLFSFSFIKGTGYHHLMVLISDITLEKESAAKEIEQLRIANELEMAQSAQKAFFPDNDITHDSFNIAAYYARASECGGDWWSYIHDQKRNILVLIIADVTGHGLHAALLTAIIKGCTDALELFMRGNIDRSLKADELLSIYHTSLFNSFHSTLYMSSLVCVIDLYSGQVEYANGGHPNAIVMRPKDKSADNSSLSYKDLDIKHLKAKGPMPGTNFQTPYEVAKYCLRPGDSIVLFTDGVYECVREDQKELGKRKFWRLLANSYNSSPRKFVDSTMAKVTEFRGGYPLEDDITFLIFKFKSN